jgi:hypothetical protein
MPQLKQGNFQELMHDIPFETLCKTFHDALTLLDILDLNTCGSTPCVSYRTA